MIESKAQTLSEFHREDTGGGCDALVWRLGEYEILITNHSQQVPREGQDILIGLYLGGVVIELLECKTFGQIDCAVQTLRALIPGLGEVRS